MANDERSLLGLRPLGWPGNAIKINYYQANTAINLFMYQPVALNNSGQVQAQAVIADMSGIIGSIVGFIDTNKAGLPTDLTDLNQAAFLASGNNALVAVADDPYQLFSLESDSGGSVIGSLNSTGQTVHYTFLATTGNTTTGISNAVLDQSTVALDTGGVLTLVKAYDIINSDGTTNDLTLNFSKWVVRINSHQNAHLHGDGLWFNMRQS